MPAACKECGEVRTTSKTYRIRSVVYTIQHFVCIHPRKEVEKK